MGKNVFLITLFSSLGDALIISNLVIKARKAGQCCYIAHLNNPHILSFLPLDLRPFAFNVLTLDGMVSLVRALSAERRKGSIVFGLQQAPGSLRGFFYLSFMKKLGTIEHLVDQNLYDADIIIPATADYILNIHLDQISVLSGMHIPVEERSLSLPDILHSSLENTQPLLVGIHPWSRRWKEPAFVWPFERWVSFVKDASINTNISFLVFGRDPRFDEFRCYLNEHLDDAVFSRISFRHVKNIKEMTGAISRCEILVSVNTGAVHLAHALKKKMVILNGPTFDFWIPKGEGVRSIRDKQARFNGSDRRGGNMHFPMVARIDVSDVLKGFQELI
ncbi:MAG: hypothetical protein HQL22_03090 [Candidatus Omnitrophica bacterium]|nr:hypothetical protein [Candidatus Omnitrophota bacterium]